MRARSREVQIFNMSLIDILCGALGAFCFMMLVLLPYYKPTGSASDIHQQEEKTDELLKELERLRQATNDPTTAQQMAETMRKLEDQIKQLQGQLNQTTAQNEQLQGQNSDLTQKNQQQSQQINARNPFFIYAAAIDLSQAIDVYVQDDLVQGGKSNPPFNPAGPHQGRFWTGDISFTVPGRAIAAWVVRDSPANVHYKLYVKLANDPAQRRPTGISSAAYGGTYNLNFPDVTLNAERFWTLLGTLTSDPQGNGTVTFQQATDAERDAEWKALSKSAPPPKPSSASASAAPQQIGPGAMAPADRRALLEQLKKASQQRQRQQQSQSPAASASPSP